MRKRQLIEFRPPRRSARIGAGVPQHRAQIDTTRCARLVVEQRPLFHERAIFKHAPTRLVAVGLQAPTAMELLTSADGATTAAPWHELWAKGALQHERGPTTHATLPHGACASPVPASPVETLFHVEVRCGFHFVQMPDSRTYGFASPRLPANKACVSLQWQP